MNEEEENVYGVMFNFEGEGLGSDIIYGLRSRYTCNCITQILLLTYLI